MIKDKVIVLDLDSCIIDTSKSIIQLHNKLNPDKYIEYNPNHDWKFKPMIKSDEELSELFKLFDHKDFYGDTLVVFSNAIEVINRLADNNRVVICSKHNKSRERLSTEWINKVMPKVEIVFVDNFEDKGKLFDNAFCVIDDRVDVLNSFNYDCLKILYGLYKWNKGCKEYHRCDNWLEIESYLNKINNYCEYVKYFRYNPDKFIEKHFGIKLKLQQRIMLKMLNSKTAKYLIGRR